MRDVPTGEVVAASLERLTRAVVRMSARGDLSLTAALTLSALDRSGPLRLTELATQGGVTQPAMTQLVSRLQEAGLVVRAGDREDGRVVQVHITDAGRAAVAQRRRVRAVLIAEALAHLDEAERAGLFVALPAIDSLAGLLPEEPAAARAVTS
ncbi:MarR family winged helix-turn-helix transcriptional regulator [Actinomadura alba]|uniref:MarR family transcriptional regulator n=1 Tax=Actinomadura alba TaxID=406431 RepID=A0ABR7LN90_9ACTN|nr:MarR family transcriptional regulator [Actinomadura alba]MBC6466239.1 MarR family transcriptional regulator [Actinomadura alba]